ncbi:MAG: IS256 family transposase, partial [Gammaproteobacteria bacterium]
LGPAATISKSTVNAVCQAIKAEFDAWRVRSLKDVELEYLFLDGSMFKMHPGARAEPVLAAWGITTDGKPCFIGLDAMSDEGTDPWSLFLSDLKGRGLRPPLLGISDGAPGLIAAFEAEFAKSLRQRCVIHRARNVLAKVPKHAKDEVKKSYWEIFDDIGQDPGDAAVAECRRRAREFEVRYHKLFPGAVKCLMEDFDSLTTHLRFPREHWRRIRHSNFIERTFGESRRRVKVIGRLPGEESCLSLVWAVLDRASRGWRGVQMNPAATRLLIQLRRELFARKKEAKRKAVARAA